MNDLRDMQAEVNEWARRNFGDTPSYRCILGAVEEIGELSHAHLKAEQGIRVNEDHEENAKDAIGDTIIYLMDYCNTKGWDLQDILASTWGQVKQRDWKANKTNGENQHE